MIAALIVGLCLCGGSATATAQADRLEPPAPAPVVVPVLWTDEAAGGRCIGLEAALSYWSPGWNVERMSRIAYRESRCSPAAANSCCTGVLQMHAMHVPEPWCGVFTRADLTDPWRNICAAAALWRTSGYGAWTTS